ncbi:hypothetical protein JOB18_009897 [Solea senegalensis]|uniref:Uncharacterized protein n=1 Tax=Solea senegalensis TaxID=28829 RepID=A0AAV6QKM8_SOLSE|nr:hypothetical protein JOB18_009897 [Solea senegalensis]
MGVEKEKTKLFENVDTLCEHVNAAPQPLRFCWENASIPIRFAVVNDASARFADEPRAQAPCEWHGHLDEALPPPSPRVIRHKLRLTAPEEYKVPGGARTRCFMCCRRVAGEEARAMGFSFSLR